MVGKYLGKALKCKNPKLEAMLELNDKIGHQMTDIYKPNNDTNQDEVFPQDFIVERVDLGMITRAENIKIFNASNKKIEHRIWKDQKDKRDMKQTI